MNHFNVAHSELEYLSDNFGNLKQLRKIHIHYSKLRELPDIFVKLGNLESVYMINNQLKSLPENMDRMENLKTLFLDDDVFFEDRPEPVLTLTYYKKYGDHVELEEIPFYTITPNFRKIINKYLL